MRRKLLFLGLLSAFSAWGQGRWELQWSDEFDVDGAPNPANWSYENGYVRNNEDQYYTRDRRENARVENGHLIIEARRDNWQGHEYTSASIITRGKHTWTYGRFELRARIDVRQGSWPAWWTVGTARGWPGGGEIDMMEFYNGRVLFNTYCGNNCNGGWDTETMSVNAAWASEFHIWRMDWDRDFIELYLDDVLMNTTDLSQTFVGNNNPFREPHYMFINQAIGGNNGGDPSNTAFPIVYEVDYVRVYEWNPNATNLPDRKDLPEAAVFQIKAGHLHIRNPGPAQSATVVLFDLLGKEVAKLKVKEEGLLDISSFQAGIYFIKINEDVLRKITLP